MFGQGSAPGGPADLKTRSLYIGNLAPQVTDQLLWDIFSIIGPVESCKVIRDKTTGQSAGFGFVDYYDPLTAAMAQDKMSGKRVYDYELKVNWAAAGGGMTGTKEDTSNHFHIFVGDLSPEVDDQTLWNAFTVFGTCSDARIMRDPTSNRSKGYGFVAFRIKEDADKALREMNGEWLGGRAIRCNWANQKMRPGTSSSTPAMSSNEVSSISALTSPTNTTVYVGNIAPEVSEQTLHAAFQDYGTIEEIRIQKEKGFAFVRYSTHDSATRAISGVNGKVLGSRAIKVSWGKEMVAPTQIPAGVPLPQMYSGMPPGLAPFGNQPANYSNTYQQW